MASASASAQAIIEAALAKYRASSAAKNLLGVLSPTLASTYAKLHHFARYQLSIQDVETLYNIRPESAPPVTTVMEEYQCVGQCIKVMRIVANRKDLKCRHPDDPACMVHHFHSTMTEEHQTHRCCQCGYVLEVDIVGMDPHLEDVVSTLHAMETEAKRNSMLGAFQQAACEPWVNTLGLLEKFLSHVLAQSWVANDEIRAKTNINTGTNKFKMCLGYLPSHVKLFKFLDFQELVEDGGKRSWVPPRVGVCEGMTSQPYRFFLRVISAIHANKNLSNVFGWKDSSESTKTAAIERSNASIMDIFGGTQYPRTPNRPPEIHAAAHQYFGAPIDVSDALLLFAMQKRLEDDSDHIDSVIEKCQALADDRGSETMKRGVENLKRYVQEQKDQEEAVGDRTATIGSILQGAMAMTVEKGAVEPVCLVNGPANINTLLLIMYRIRPLRNAVIMFRVPMKPEGNSPEEAVMLELQALFVCLMKGNSVAYSSEKFARVLYRARPALRGEESAVRVAEEFLATIESAMCSSEGGDLECIRRLFRLSVNEPREGAFQSEVRSVLSFTMNAADIAGQASLLNAMRARVLGGNGTPNSRRITLEQPLPKVLLIGLPDRPAGSILRVDKTLYLDQFMAGSTTMELATVQAEEDAVADRLSNKREELHSLQQYKDTGYTREALLVMASELMNNIGGDDSTSAALNEAAVQLKDHERNVEQQVKQLVDRQQELMYGGSLFQYSLQAMLVASPGRKNRAVYVLDPDRAQWYLQEDSHVREAASERVATNAASGGDRQWIPRVLVFVAADAVADQVTDDFDSELIDPVALAKVNEHNHTIKELKRPY